MRRACPRYVRSDTMGSMFTSVAQEKNYQAIISQVKNAIISGKLKVGDQLPPERELVRIFNVSRSSVREALKALEVQGIVQSYQGGGYFVVNSILCSIADSLSLFFMLEGCSLEELIQLRTSLELGSLSIIIQYRTDEEIAVLGTYMDKYVASTTSEERQMHDLNFHTALVELSRNPLYKYLLNAMHYIYTKNVALSNLVVEDKGAMDETIAMHVALYTAIRERNYDRASAELLRHFNFTKDDIQRQTEYFFTNSHEEPINHEKEIDEGASRTAEPKKESQII